MPILITNKSYTDNFGNTGLTAYKSNAGDRFNVVLDIESNIRVQSSASVYLTIDAVDNQIEWVGGDFLEEGFRVGDQVTLTKYAQNGTPLVSWTTNINYVDQTIMDIDVLQTAGIDYGSGESLVILVDLRGRSDLELEFNHILNSANGNEFSLIDGEATRVLFDGFGSLGVGGFQPGVLVGNQSGQFIISAQISRVANPANQTRGYRISIDFVNSGIYDDSWFQSSDCLKLFVKMDFASLPGEVDNSYILTYSEDANTGWYDEPFNSAPYDSALIQGITDDLDYCNPSTHEIIVDGVLSPIGLGAAYVSIDESYYKNRPFRQNEITMLIPSFSTGLAFANSDTNEDGAGYTITINSVTVIGSETTINFTFTPNAFFAPFMDSRDPGDRLFYIWVKAGSINWLVYSDQLTCVLPEGDPLQMVDEITYLDHSENIESKLGVFDQINFDTEDDLAFYGTFRLEKNKIYETLSIKIEAFNQTTEEDFTLSEFLYNFSGVQISGDGRYLLNESQTVVPQLPLTSLKRDSKFQLYNSLDTPTEYGVSLYAPVILRWEYWLEQLNASTDFWPTQDKNWEQYDNIGDWIVRIEIILSDGTFNHPYRKQIEINPYDDEKNIVSTIELIRDLDNSVVNIIPEGELMRIRATHVKASAWDQLLTWGMITIEPFESAPRWISSSVVDFDNNSNNPLTPLTGSVIAINYPAADTAVLECYFDSNKIDLSNGVKITAKIKEKDAPIELKTTSPDDEQKTTATPLGTGNDKTTAP